MFLRIKHTLANVNFKGLHFFMHGYLHSTHQCVLNGYALDNYEIVYAGSQYTLISPPQKEA